MLSVALQYGNAHVSVRRAPLSCIAKRIDAAAMIHSAEYAVLCNPPPAAPGAEITAGAGDSAHLEEVVHAGYHAARTQMPRAATAPSTRSSTLAMHVDLDCLRANTDQPGHMEQDRQVRLVCMVESRHARYDHNRQETRDQRTPAACTIFVTPS